MFSIEAYWHWNKQRYLPWRLKVQGTHTVSSRCPVQLDITFTKINTIYSNATRHTAKSTSISDLWYVTSQGYNQLKFQHLFHLLLLNVMRWIVHLRIQSPKQLEFISHSQRSTQSTQMQLDILPSPQVYQIFDMLHLRGTTNWSFNIYFIFFYLMWWGELFTFEFNHLSNSNSSHTHILPIMQHITCWDSSIQYTSHCSYMYVYPFLILLEL